MKEVLTTIFITLLVLGGIHLIKEWNNEREKSPFWKDTELLRVCKTPYYSSEECYKFPVTLVNSKQAQVHTEDNQSFTLSNLTCWNSAQYKNEREYVFCRSWDVNGHQWDLMPIWAYIPNAEDLQKQIEIIKDY